MKRKRLFEVKGEDGCFLATYFAYTPIEAIRRLAADQYQTASVFRRSQPAIELGNLTATEVPQLFGDAR